MTILKGYNGYIVINGKNMAQLYKNEEIYVDGMHVVGGMLELTYNTEGSPFDDNVLYELSRSGMSNVRAIIKSPILELRFIVKGMVRKEDRVEFIGVFNNPTMAIKDLLASARNEVSKWPLVIQ